MRSADFLQVVLDVSSDGQLQLPPYPDNSPTQIYNITIFLTSYDTGKNFTISNGTSIPGNLNLGQVMQQEPSSTVKHVNWIWPDFLVGDGPSSTKDKSKLQTNPSDTPALGSTAETQPDPFENPRGARSIVPPPPLTLRADDCTNSSSARGLYNVSAKMLTPQSLFITSRSQSIKTFASMEPMNTQSSTFPYRS